MAENVSRTEKTFVARPMKNRSVFTAPVDIIIPYHGQYDKVTSLLESIYAKTRTNHIEIYLIDDASPNEAFINSLSSNISKSAEKRNIENNFHAYRSAEKVGFAGAMKKAFEKGSNPYVCFLHSDCLVEDPLWLSSMGEALLKNIKNNVRMVSAMTNDPVGGDPAQKGTRTGKEDEVVVLGEDSYLSLYCFMCHRELFKRCGGFLKEYPYGMYEDEEFAHRMRHYGYKQAVCRNSWIKHEGMATVKELWKNNSKICDIMKVENRKRCVEDIQKLKA